MKTPLLASLLVATASGCGGGVSTSTAVSAATPAPVASPPAAPAPSPAPVAAVTLKGFISGTFATDRAFHGVVLPDGTFYGVYASASNPNAVGGALQGTGTSSNSSSYSASNIEDLSAEGLGVRNASLSATYVDEYSLTGTLTYALAGVAAAPLIGSLSYTPTTSNLSTVTGNFTGSFAVSPNSALTANLSIDASGNVAGTVSSGCRFSGQVTTTSLDAVYNLSLTLGSAPCTPVNATVSGAAYFFGSTSTLYGVAVPGDRSSAVIFGLLKQ